MIAGKMSATSASRCVCGAELFRPDVGALRDASRFKRGSASRFKRMQQPEQIAFTIYIRAQHQDNNTVAH
jgi:hypothetical protein